MQLLAFRHRLFMSAVLITLIIWSQSERKVCVPQVQLFHKGMKIAVALSCSQLQIFLVTKIYKDESFKCSAHSSDALGC